MTTRKTTAVLGWFPTTPATEHVIIDMTPARLVALRVHLRNHYWLTDCTPLTDQAMHQVMKRMQFADPRDTIDPDELAQLLTVHYGFHQEAAGWSIPELLERREEAIASMRAVSERNSAAGVKSGAARRSKPTATAPTTVGGDATDF